LDNLKINKNKRIILSENQLPKIYSEKAPRLDLEELKSALHQWYDSYPISNNLMKQIQELNQKEINYNLPIIGCYGKIGESKGSYDLLNALEIVSDRGLEFNFFYIAGSNKAKLEKFYEIVMTKGSLKKHMWILPMLAPWRIPSFIRLCTIVCYLERNFPLSIHSPIIPREVLAAGTCLVCSGEIIQKQWFKENMVDHKNYILIPNPSELKELSDRIELLIKDKNLLNDISWHAKMLSKFIESQYKEIHSLISLFDYNSNIE
jgi:glycosyltransferase involved in cell wall biosynthesis